MLVVGSEPYKGIHLRTCAWIHTDITCLRHLGGEGMGPHLGYDLLLMHSRFATFYNCSWCGLTAGGGVRLCGSGGLPCAHTLGKCSTKPAPNERFGRGTTLVPSGIKPIVPKWRQSACGRLHATVSVSSRYGSDAVSSKIEPRSCRQDEPGDFVAVRPLNWDERIDEDDDDENWTAHGEPRGGRSRSGNSSENDDGKGEHDTQRGDTGTRKGMGPKNGKGKEKAT